jgi:hypothetical protein
VRREIGDAPSSGKGPGKQVNFFHPPFLQPFLVPRLTVSVAFRVVVPGPPSVLAKVMVAGYVPGLNPQAFTERVSVTVGGTVPVVKEAFSQLGIPEIE